VAQEIERLEDITDELESALASEAGTKIRSEIRKETEKFDFSLEKYMQATIEDPNCKDIDIPLSRAGDALYVCRENMAESEDDWDMAFAKFTLAIIAALDCLTQLAAASDLLGPQFYNVEEESPGAGYEYEEEPGEGIQELDGYPQLPAEDEDYSYEDDESEDEEDEFEANGLSAIG